MKDAIIITIIFLIAIALEYTREPTQIQIKVDSSICKTKVK